MRKTTGPWHCSRCTRGDHGWGCVGLLNTDPDYVTALERVAESAREYRIYKVAQNGVQMGFAWKAMTDALNDLEELNSYSSPESEDLDAKKP